MQKSYQNNSGVNRSIFLERKERNRSAIREHQEAILKSRKDKQMEIKHISGNASQLKHQIDRE